MTPSGDPHASIERLWGQVAREQDRAARAADVAADYEAQSNDGSDFLRAHRGRMAALHRQIAERHLASARIQEEHASRLQRWTERAESGAPRPVFMAAVASVVGMGGASLTLLGRRRTEAVVAHSDPVARKAHDLELVMGEGPRRDATDGGEPVAAAGPGLTTTWPLYGPGLRELGMYAVIAVPLGSPSTCLGSLAVYDRQPSIGDETVATTGRIAAALTYSVLHDSDVGQVAHGSSDLPIFDDDAQPIVHQAAGIVSVHCACAIDDALALLRARAFADGRTVGEIARAVVQDGLRL